MEHVILGLLMIRPMSQYDLVKAFERTISLFYSASSGSIRRALDILAGRGSIEVASVEGARGRTVWAVTDQGRAELRDWMLLPLSSGSERDLLARVYFLGLVGPREREIVRAHVVAATRTALQRLEVLEEATDAVEVPDEWAQVARYQQHTLDLGLRQARVALEWAAALPVTGSEVPVRDGRTRR